MMPATDLLLDASISTTERVAEAWHGAHRVTRQAWGAAVITTVLIAMIATADIALRTGLVVSGMAIATAALVDVHERKLPNRLVGIALGAAVVATLATGSGARMADLCIGALVAGGAMFVVRLCRGIGMGDVKMAVAVGASVAPLVPVAAPIAIAITATVAALYGLASRRSTLALGPALWFGWASAVVLAHSLVGWPA